MKKFWIILGTAFLLAVFLCIYAFGIVGYRCSTISNTYKHQYNTYGIFCRVPSLEDNLQIEVTDYDG